MAIPAAVPGASAHGRPLGFCSESLELFLLGALRDGSTLPTIDGRKGDAELIRELLLGEAKTLAERKDVEGKI